MKKSNTGHKVEEYYSHIFNEMGFKFCSVSFYTSKIHDSAKVDLINLPFNIQIKGFKQKNLKAGKELFEMKNMIKALFPTSDSIHDRPCFLLHSKQVGKDKNRTYNHEIIYMSKKQFDECEKYFSKGLKSLYTDRFKFKMDSEFRCVVAVSFKEFKKIINKMFKNDKN